MCATNSAVYRVFLVDDNVKWHFCVRALLSKNQKLLVVGEATDGQEAIRRIEEQVPDLVLLDIGLPTLNGVELSRHIAKTVPSAKVLFVTSSIEPTTVILAMSNGARGYVLKGDAGSDLLPAVEAVLQGERFLSQGLQGRQSKQIYSARSR